MPTPAVADDPLNLARGKTYTLSPPPNYAHCADADDDKQLTDGVHAGCDWRKKSTVGWNWPETNPTIIIDLGSVEPVDEVRIDTVGGGKAGVFFPAHILLMVSDDGDRFHAVGAVSSIGMVQDRNRTPAAARTPHTFTLQELKTRGRYVLVAIEPDPPFVFLEEIEVNRGKHNAAEVTFAPENHFPQTRVSSLFSTVRRRAVVLDDLNEFSRWRHPHSVEIPSDTLLSLILRSRRIGLYDAEVWRDLARELDAERGKALFDLRGERWIWAVVDPMPQSRPTDLYSYWHSTNRRIEMECWQGEYESAAVAVVNCGSKPLRLYADVSALRMADGNMILPDQYMTLRVSIPVEGRSIGVVEDALGKLAESGTVIPAGQARQIWLTFHHRALTAGQYDFGLRVVANEDGAAEEPVIIPGRIVVHPLVMPAEPTLRTCTWSYVNQAELLESIPNEALADLHAHYTDVFVIVPRAIPKPMRNSEGRMQLDFTQLDAELKTYAGAGQYLFFWGMNKTRRTLLELGEPGSEAWKATIKEWLPLWVAHLRELGIDYDRYAMYPIDESLCDEFFELARFIKQEVDPKIRLFANSRGRDGTNEFDRIRPYIDIWCPPDRPYAGDDPLTGRRDVGEAEWWTYAALGPGKANAPYAYYRLQPWRAFARGDTGCGFWVYSDQKEGASEVWNDYYRHDGWYGVVYGPKGAPTDTHGERLIPSRRWEAWREGIEDYEYLHRLKALIRDGRSRGVDPQRVSQAEATLREAVKTVLTRPEDPETVYLARRHLTDAILALSVPNK